MSAQEFNCILCKESFENKEDLQVHFRKHGDPKFNQNVKSKSRNESEGSGDKASEDGEMVSCDVCTETFPTISKAITHKHKVHPDHEAKYFCPWCGKLFTMKHLYNKHIQTSHDSNEDCEDKGFHCDYCEVDFFVAPAMVYHNKFFHRQDTELASIGQSRKLKMFNQELLQIYYCPFCGEEYFNKVNLHKHMGDDHNDENQSPDDVLRCPLCDAIFYHLDAYEVHITFHSSEDVYSEENEIANEVTEYSLETVPPIMEKVESCESQEDAEATMNSVGLESILQQAMNESVDHDNPHHESLPGKKKKHKKHKKSKKAAITLDEFLSMNTDVFGEGIDFQGIEEVPTQVVAKQLKKQAPRPRHGPKAMPSRELEKLKKQGIVVKMKSGKRPALQGAKVLNKQISKTFNAAQNRKTSQVKPTQTKTNTKNDSSDVLSKLLSQTNSQLKIVKKPTLECSTSDQKESPENNADKNSPENEKIDSNSVLPKVTADNTEDILSNVAEDNSKKRDVINSDTEADSDYLKNSSQHVETLSTENTNPPSTNENECTKNVITNNDEHPESPKRSDSSEISKLETVNSTNPLKALRNISQHITIKPVATPKKSVEEQNNDDFDASHTEDHDIGGITKNIERATEKNDNSYNKDTLNALKHLSHLLTVKSVNQSKNTIPAKVKNDTKEGEINDQEVAPKEINDDLEDNENPEVIKNPIETTPKAIKEIPQSPKKESPKHLDALKNLSKHITIKSLNQSETIKDISLNKESDGNERNKNDIDVDIGINKTATADTKNFSNTKTVLNKRPVELNSSKQKVPEIRNQSPKIIKPAMVKEIQKPVEKLNVMDIKKQSCANILKQLPNVTAKPLNVTKNLQQVTSSTERFSTQTMNVTKDNYTHKFVKKEERKEEIEVFNVDDSDDEEINKQNISSAASTTTIVNQQTSEHKNTAVKSIDALKSLSKHITVKSTNFQHSSITKEMQNAEAILEHGTHENCDDFDSDIRKPVGQKNKALQHTLKNLSKHITVKSRNSSPNTRVQKQDINAKNNTQLDDFDSDSNNSTKRGVQITEVDDENESANDILSGQNGTRNCQLPKNVTIHTPDGSNSENEEFPQEHEVSSDIEKEINKILEVQANTLKMAAQERSPNKKSAYLKNLENINKGLTIKSLKEDKIYEKDDTETACDEIEVPNLKNELSITPFKQIKSVRQDNCESNNKSAKRFTEQAINKSGMNQSVASSNQVNTVNKEVTVKTFQTKTVIQEITTTVTKTIRTVNQSVTQENQIIKQEMRNVNRGPGIPLMRPQKIQGMRPNHNQQIKNYQGIPVRQAAPSGPRVRNAVPTARSTVGAIRPSNQLVPVRPGINVTRANSPRMPVMKKPTCSPQQPMIGKPLKISPSVMVQSTKRPTEDAEDSSGPFSCFKKQKESLIPVPDLPAFDYKLEGDSSVQFASSSHISKSNVTSSTKIAKGGSTITSTKTKSEISASSEQLDRLSNMSGLKIMKTSQSKRAMQVEEKTETSASKRTTLEAIEKLQKQGLLVKKPRLDEDNFSEHSNPCEDDDFDT